MAKNIMDDRLKNLPGAKNPVERVREVADLLPAARGPEMPLRTTLEGGSIYSVVRWSSVDQTTGTFYNAKRYQIRGDHLYVAHLSGSNAVYVRLGPDSNPWIRVQQGETYRRKFSSFAVRVADEAGFTASSDVVFYISEGPLVLRAPFQPGLDCGFVADDMQVATTTTQHVLGTFASGRETVGKNGGLLLLKNIDASGTLYFARSLAGVVGIAGGQPQGYPLAPGDSIKLDLRSKMIQRVAGNQIHVPIVYTKVGTCQYAFLLSGFEDDIFEVENTQPGGLTT